MQNMCHTVQRPLTALSAIHRSFIHLTESLSKSDSFMGVCAKSDRWDIENDKDGKPSNKFSTSGWVKRTAKVSS